MEGETYVGTILVQVQAATPVEAAERLDKIGHVVADHPYALRTMVQPPRKATPTEEIH